MRFRALGLAVVAVACLAPSTAMAQLKRIPAEIVTLIESPGVRSGTTVRAAVQVTLPEGFHVQSNAPRDPSLIATELTVDGESGVQATEVVFPKAIEFRQDGLPEPLLVFDRHFTIGVQLAVPPTLAPGSYAVPICPALSGVRRQGVLRADHGAQRMDRRGRRVRPQQRAAALRGVRRDSRSGPVSRRRTAARPRSAGTPPAASGAATGDGLAGLERFAVVATTGGYQGTADFMTFIQNAEAGVTERGLFEGRGPLAILLLVLVGGLALNLTPCVLPMIPINLAIIGAGAQAGSRRRGFLLGLTYGGAMAFVYGVLGLVVVLTASTFGTINASPWFNLAIAVLFVALALAMFDVFEIDFSRFAGTVGAGANRGTFTLAFTMGGVAALLAGACVAPVVIQVVLFASNLYATGTSVALALPFFLGIGMAIPWPIAGAGLSKLPKPGPWMVRVKQGFGVLILGTAVYYGYLSYGLFADRWVDAAEVSSSVEDKLKAGWHASLADGLAAAEREGKPVLVDLWATWCKNCLTMDKTTLASPEVTQALTGYVKIKLQAEQPDEPPAAEVMKRFKAVGLPAYAILKPAPRSAGK